jgi:hypothetical protein
LPICNRLIALLKAFSSSINGVSSIGGLATKTYLPFLSNGIIFKKRARNLRLARALFTALPIFLLATKPTYGSFSSTIAKSTNDLSCQRLFDLYTLLKSAVLLSEE